MALSIYSIQLCGFYLCGGSFVYRTSALHLQSKWEKKKTFVNKEDSVFVRVNLAKREPLAKRERVVKE